MSSKTTPKTQLTQDGYDEIVRELKELEEVKLPEVIKRVELARGYGDLSENAEYHSAKEDQELTETRIAELQAILQNAVIVASTAKTTAIGIGCTVTVSFKRGKTTKKQTFLIVGEFEADPNAGKISSASPIGIALVGKKKGDVVKVETPAGMVEYTILEIK
ncbi:transcription elongation factor GreA [Patescibacteria group bacterium]|nr:transcription elongation factor GreA [Patescibacteria group bacterium]